MAQPQNFVVGWPRIVGMLLPLLYFAGLLYYFSGVDGGTLAGIIEIGLGPTMFGLAFLGLLFSIKPLIMLVRLVAGMSGRPPEMPTPHNIGDVPDARLGERGGFDADAAVARYLAKRATAGPTAAPARSSFGRKAR